jgi:hypothetical protein
MVVTDIESKLLSLHIWQGPSFSMMRSNRVMLHNYLKESISIRVSAVVLNAKWKRAETLVLLGINLSYTALRETTIYYVGLQPLAVS